MISELDILENSTKIKTQVPYKALRHIADEGDVRRAYGYISKFNINSYLYIFNSFIPNSFFVVFIKII